MSAWLDGAALGLERTRLYLRTPSAPGSQPGAASWAPSPRRGSPRATRANIPWQEGKGEALGTLSDGKGGGQQPVGSSKSSGMRSRL